MVMRAREGTVHDITGIMIIIHRPIWSEPLRVKREFWYTNKIQSSQFSMWLNLEMYFKWQIIMFAIRKETNEIDFSPLITIGNAKKCEFISITNFKIRKIIISIEVNNYRRKCHKKKITNSNKIVGMWRKNSQIVTVVARHTRSTHAKEFQHS